MVMVETMDTEKSDVGLSFKRLWIELPIGLNVPELREMLQRGVSTVISIEVVRNNEHSTGFGFVNVSEKEEQRLRDTYNNCSWRGNRLKILPANPCYLDILRREWAEEASRARLQDKDQTEALFLFYFFAVLHLLICQCYFNVER